MARAVVPTRPSFSASAPLGSHEPLCSPSVIRPGRTAAFSASFQVFQGSPPRWNVARVPK